MRHAIAAGSIRAVQRVAELVTRPREDAAGYPVVSDGGGTGMMTVRGAMFLGVGGTAGAGIFALLGALDAIWKRRRKAPDAAALPHPS